MPGRIDPDDINALSGRIIGAAIQVHRELGPGLLESTYESCFAVELASRELAFERQRHLPVRYRGLKMTSRYRLDFLVEDRIVVEIKAVDRLDPIHTAQMLTYLQLTGCYIGLLINFNVRILTGGGIRRVVKGLPEPHPALRLHHDR